MLGEMRQARIKVDSTEGEAVYHVMTRTVNGEPLLDDVAKEVLRKQLWQIADYCGLEIITYAIMSNHFHVLVRVPQRTAVADDELIRRYRVLYPKPTKYQTAKFQVIQSQLKKNEPEAQQWRDRQLAMMGDLSPFMKLVKQRFSVWYNRSHQRYGTLWAERFKSVLVEAKSGGEAVSGNKSAQKGLQRLIEGGRSHAWEWTQQAYRETLFGKAAAPKEHQAHIDAEALQKVIKSKGRLPLHQVLRCRVRYFSDGAVLGTQAFVQEHLGTYQKLTGRRNRTAPRPVPRVTDWGDLTTLRGLRRSAFG